MGDELDKLNDSQSNKAEMFISMAFQDVDTSGKVVNTQAKVPSSTQEAFGKNEADRDDELARSVIEDD